MSVVTINNYVIYFAPLADSIFRSPLLLTRLICSFAIGLKVR